MNKKQINSVPGKLRSLKEGESMVLYTDDYKKFMRELASAAYRNYDDPKFTYKKAMVIVDDILKIGVEITLNKIMPKTNKGNPKK